MAQFASFTFFPGGSLLYPFLIVWGLFNSTPVLPSSAFILPVLVGAVTLIICVTANQQIGHREIGSRLTGKWKWLTFPFPRPV